MRKAYLKLCASTLASRLCRDSDVAFIASNTLRCNQTSATSSSSLMNVLSASVSNHHHFLPSTLPTALAMTRGFATSPRTPRKPSRSTDPRKFLKTRNDRLRQGFENIWPCRQLPDEKREFFAQNSRVFIVDLGRTMPLITKFRMNPNDAKPSMQEARVRLFEKDLNVDLLGEHPHFVRVRRLKYAYSNKLFSVTKIRNLLGGWRRYRLQMMFEASVRQEGHNRVWKLICGMESLLVQQVTRMGVAEDILDATYHVSKHRFRVNGQPIIYKNKYHCKPADVISPTSVGPEFIKAHITEKLFPFFADAYCKYDPTIAAAMPSSMDPTQLMQPTVQKKPAEAAGA